MKHLLSLVAFVTFTSQAAPLRVLIAGTSHGHVDWALNRDPSVLEIVGIQDENLAHARVLAHNHGLPPDRVFAQLPEAIAATNPEGILAFGAIDEHLSVVRAASARRIPVMVEKPLAHTLESALDIQEIAQRTGTTVLVNYETTWYPALERALEMVPQFGKLRRAQIRSGHFGPVELGVKPEFMRWLGDPDRGGGALMDFGCYGINILTKLRRGEVPSRVSAMTFTNKPNLYPRVEDESTILLQYPSGFQAVIEGSWNWPFERKDSEFFAERGYVAQHTKDQISWKDRSFGDRESSPPRQERVTRLRKSEVYRDPFTYFRAVVRGETRVEAWDLSGLDNNMVVMRVLNAAKRSAKNGGAPQGLR